MGNFTTLCVKYYCAFWFNFKICLKIKHIPIRTVLVIHGVLIGFDHEMGFVEYILLSLGTTLMLPVF